MIELGFAGRLAKKFINSKLTPLIVLASVLLGIGAVYMLPREEEPQIVVPMVDIYLPMPGSSPQEVQERVVKPFEAKLWEIKGVEYLYSMSRPGMGIITVRFQVGQPFRPGETVVGAQGAFEQTLLRCNSGLERLGNSFLPV